MKSLKTYNENVFQLAEGRVENFSISFLGLTPMNPFALNGQVLFSYELALHKISDILFFVSQKSQ